MVSPLQQYMKEREEGKKRTQELRSMSASETIKYLQKSEPERNKAGKAQGYRPLNLNDFLKQKGVSSDPNVELVVKNKPIDVDKVESWQQLRDSQKQHELRKTIADYETIPSNIPSGTPKIDEEPLARRMGFGQGGGTANLGITGYQTLTEPEPTNFTEWIAGRINTPIQEPETITKEPEIIEVTPEPIIEHSVRHELEPVNKSIILIGAAIGIVALVLVWRMKK